MPYASFNDVGVLIQAVRFVTHRRAVYKSQRRRTVPKGNAMLDTPAPNPGDGKRVRGILPGERRGRGATGGQGRQRAAIRASARSRRMPGTRT